MCITNGYQQISTSQAKELSLINANLQFDKISIVQGALGKSEIQPCINC